jgi:hypothetical protein
VASDYEESVARRSLRYFYLSPTAYIFSAVYPESLLVCITLGALLSARYKRWWLAGLFGFFAALTKPVGFIVLIPILYMYFQSVGFSWKNIRFDILNFLLVPLGLICFALYSYFAVGDFFAYIHVHVQSSGYSLSNPLVIMFKSFFQGNIHTIINALAVIIASVVLILGYKKISFGYWLFALALILFGPSMGTTLGSLRYLAIIFPLIIILSLLGRDSENDKGIGSVMALLQGCIFIFWTAGYLFAI